MLADTQKSATGITLNYFTFA